MSIFSQFFPFLNSSSLSTSERSLLLHSCAFVALSDGQASVGEMSSFKKNVAEIGGFHSSEIEKAFSEKILLEANFANDLKNLAPPKAHMILKLLFIISNSDDKITDDELNAIRSICELMMPKNNWTDIYNWISNYKNFVDSTKKLFGKH